MSRSRRDIERLLSKDESELVEQAKQPALGQVSDTDLSALAKRLREARDKAQTIAQRQRREMRGKAAPQGAKPASDNSGSVEKSALLASAMQRVNKESARRRAKDGKSDLVNNAQKALKAKKAKPDPQANRPQSRTADEGMTVIENEKKPTDGALEQEGFKPVLERSRKVR
ncbi:hypothetical protein SAMN05216456_2779 [Devosia crocina]|uniref:Uncharacterized protein n=1 Tax=Devosia crocina TaxID=429728 RepID=A0A1I7NR39_9HYPH|nr:hypothetical protein [Devosia crocina]SFV37161.1 hypothetical protein SAMN05216456_2779 [Devosia crocina]